MGEPTRSRAWLLTSPWFVGSIALLAVNDHLLKHAWPGLVTGKLSDVAGVAMVAIALTALTGRRALAFAVTAVAFTALKTLPAVATAAAPVLGGVTRTDPTDLLALAVLVPLAALVRSPGGVRRTSAPDVALQAVMVAAAVAVTTATSCANGGPEAFRVADGVVYTRASGTSWESRDGGATWHSTDVDVYELASDPDANRCAGERCFSIDPATSSVVEHRGDATNAILEWDEPRRIALAEHVDWSCGEGSLQGLAAVETDGDVNLIVSMTEAGTLRWTGSTDTWEWVAVGGWGVEGARVAGIDVGVDADGPSFFSSTWPGRAVLVATTLLTFLAAPIVGRVARSRRREPGGYSAAVVVIGFATLVPLVGLSALASDWRNGDGPALLGAALVVAAGVAALVGAVAAMASRPRRGLAPPDGRTRVG